MFSVQTVLGAAVEAVAHGRGAVRALGGGLVADGLDHARVEISQRVAYAGLAFVHKTPESVFRSLCPQFPQPSFRDAQLFGLRLEADVLRGGRVVLVAGFAWCSAERITGAVACHGFQQVSLQLQRCVFHGIVQACQDPGRVEDAVEVHGCCGRRLDGCPEGRIRQ